MLMLVVVIACHLCSSHLGSPGPINLGEPSAPGVFGCIIAPNLLPFCERFGEEACVSCELFMSCQ